VIELNWVPITYRDFYDIPRAIVVKRSGLLYFFDCAFDEMADEYPDFYNVYLLPAEMAAIIDESSWEGLAEQGKFLARVPVRDVKLDVSRRASMRDDIFDVLPESENDQSKGRH
jgi:hypothetical protein